MKKLFLLSVAAIATSMVASATNLTFNCNAFPVAFTSGGGSTSVTCPAISGAPAGSTLNSVSLAYYVDYQFGGTAGTNTVNVTFTPATFGVPTVTWNPSTLVVSDSGGQNSGPIQTGASSALSGVSMSNFANPFTVNISSAIQSGSVTTSSGAVSVTYNYTATPEPATFSLIGLSLVGVGYLARRKRSA